MKRSNKGIWLRFFVLAIFATSLFRCSSEYERVLAREKAKNVRHDSIFMGLYLGMPAKDFYTRCWDLNKQGKLIQGPSNLSAEHKLDSSVLGAPAFMRFYPVFKDNKILAMPVEFSYEAWAPWNKNLFSDEMLPKVKALLEQWYGEGFITIASRERNIVVFVKVDGNREVRLYRKNDATVKVEIIDLLRTENPV